MEPVESWIDFDFDTYPTSGIIEEEMVEGYDIDRFDDNGFNKDGYNLNGAHHLDAPYEWQGAVDPIHPATAQREILAGVLEHISDKAEITEEIYEGDDEEG